MLCPLRYNVCRSIRVPKCNVLDCGLRRNDSSKTVHSESLVKEAFVKDG